MGIKCKDLIYTPINALTFRISGGIRTLTPHYDNDHKIVCLEDEKDFTHKLGDCIRVKGLKYKINNIKKTIVKRTPVYDISSSKRTKASTFIMPMLGGDRSVFFWNTLFINCYIEDKSKILLVYRFSHDPIFIKFEKALRKFKHFIEIRDPDPEYVVFVFNIPELHQRDFNLFIKFFSLRKDI